MFKDLFRAILSDETIIAMNKNKELIVDPLRKEQVQPNSVDLTLSDHIARPITSSGIIDPAREIEYEHLEMSDITYDDHSSVVDRYIINPGEFVLMSSNEMLNIPNGIVAFVAGRSSIARLGIQVEQAGLVDAGFRGTITFEVYNQTNRPVILYRGMRIAQIYFIKAQYASIPYGSRGSNSKYQRQTIATGSKISNDREMSTINDLSI